MAKQRSMPVVLVGHSMGGAVARAAAVAFESDPVSSEDLMTLNLLCLFVRELCTLACLTLYLCSLPVSLSL